MMGFLPEKVYRAVKDDPEYKEFETELNAVVETYDMVERILKEERLKETSMYLKEKRDRAIVRVCPPEMQRAARIIETGYENELLAMLEGETDLENKLLIYQNLIGMAYFISNSKAAPYVREFIDIVESSGQVFSEKVHEEYFTFKCFTIKQGIFKSPESKYVPGMFSEYCSQMDTLIADICAKFDNTPYINNLLHHCKVFQLYDFFGAMMDCFGPMLEFGDVIEQEVLPELERIEFKYAQFNFYKVRLLDLVCKYYFDIRSERFFGALETMINLINFSLAPENRAMVNKALNYYNDRLTIYYLNMVTKYRYIVEKELVNFSVKVNLSNMTANELRLTDDFRSSAEILRTEYGIEFYMNDTVSAICNKIAGDNKFYIEFNKEHWDTFRWMLDKHSA